MSVEKSPHADLESSKDNQAELDELKQRIASAEKEVAELKQLLSHASSLTEPIGDGFDKIRISQKTVYILELLDGELEVEEAKLNEAMHFADEQEQTFTVYKYSELADGEDLQQHVLRMNASAKCPGPYDEDTMIYASKRFMGVSQIPNFEITKKMLAQWWKGGYWKFWREADQEHTTHTALHQSQEWNAFLKNCMLGNFQPYGLIAINNGAPGKHQAQSLYIINAPIVIRGSDGKRYWGQIRQAELLLRNNYHETFMRYIHFVKNTPVCMTVVNSETGAILHQNHASTATFGNHGSLNQIQMRPGINEKRIRTATSPLSISEDSSEEGLSFIELLFLGSDDLKNLKGTRINGLFSTRVEIKSQRLRSWMQLGPEEEAFHDLKSIVIQDPNTFTPIYILTHIDVTDTVLAQKAVWKANEELADEKVRMDALLRRQYELIEVLKNMPMDDGPGRGDMSDVKDKVRMLHDALAEAGAVSPAEADDIKLLNVLGQGTFGTVYLGEWRGAAVAVKRLVLPAAMSNSERAQKMAVMEIAISSSMFHPNLVQTYTYSIKQLRDNASDEGLKFVGGSGSHVNAHEMRLVLEYCDRGSLDASVEANKGLRDKSGTLMLANLIETAADIAKGMLHLHKNNVCHNDLKAANVLLKSEGTDGRGVRAKVMDFGLSIKLDARATHVSNLFQGTVTHMAPEVLMEGKTSKSADVYAFGMTLWELVSGGSPYKGIPQVALGQLIVFKHKRPSFPHDIPPALRNIAEMCWHPLASSRPTFETILDDLQKIRADLLETPQPWPVASSAPPPLGTHDETKGSIEAPVDKLSTAKYISQASSGGFDNWVPTIVGDERADGQIESKTGSVTRFSEQVKYVDPRPPLTNDKKGSGAASEGLRGAPSTSAGDSISLVSPSSGRPSEHSHSSQTSSSTKDKGSKSTTGKDKILDSKRSSSLAFRTVDSINAEHSISPPDLNRKSVQGPKKQVSEIIPSTNFDFPKSSNAQPPPSPTRLNLGDLKHAVGKSGSTRLIGQDQSGQQPMPAMTIKMSLQPPPLKPFLLPAASAPLPPGTGRLESPVRCTPGITTIEEEQCEYSAAPPPSLLQLKEAGVERKARVAVLSPASMEYDKSFKGDGPPFPQPSVSFYDSPSTTDRRRSGTGSKGWLSFLSPGSSTHVSRTGSVEGTSSTSRVLGGSSSGRHPKAERSLGFSRSLKGSLGRLLGLGKKRESGSGSGAMYSSTASTVYSKDHPPLAPGEERRTSDPATTCGPSSGVLSARGPSSGTLSGGVVNQPRSKSVGGKSVGKSKSFLGLFRRKRVTDQ